MLINVSARPRQELTFREAQRSGEDIGRHLRDSSAPADHRRSTATPIPGCLAVHRTQRTPTKIDVGWPPVRSDPGATCRELGVNNATVARSLGRNLSNMAANVTVNLVARRFTAASAG